MKPHKASHIIACRNGSKTSREDFLAVEEPLLISLQGPEQTEPTPLLSIMRTPGDDENLVRGFLFAEGIIDKQGQITTIEHFDDLGERDENHLVVSLNEQHVPVSERRFTANSSCGVCGRLLIEDIEKLSNRPMNPNGPYLSESVVLQITNRAKTEQPLFELTGASHAASLYSANGELIAVCEDIGRHNALDKLIGMTLTNEPQLLAEAILLVSGRASYELAQKAVRAGIPVMLAVGAPSSLAVRIAQRFDMTLIGFLKSSRYNIYHGQWRMQTEDLPNVT
ncbi:MAG: formate dehydrogenase accessory sulfurtransferase FdhD [Gammaproteobacteria bacterium]|nr:formate dehydrogenase accessory sulfurtransferase FdhD [Gammaproteobacteria bacterium]NNJ71895.1 formate dehydrogenase accessory sulfurtransferase FdhD [Enterobacterales bacterium]